MTPIERAALAVTEIAFIDIHACITNPEEVVTAVLQAIREPSEAMIYVGASADRGEAWATIEWIGDAWTAMIDAALNERSHLTPI